VLTVGSDAVVVGAGALVGAVAGGFVPRVVERLSVAYGEPWRSECVHCAVPFRLPHQRAYAGWVRFGGRCRSCGGGGRAGTPVVVTALVFASLCWSIGPRADLPAFLVTGAFGVVLALVDLRCLRLPNAVVGRAMVGALLLFGGAAVAGDGGGAWVRALLGALVLFCGYLVLHLISPGSMGRGDVNLAALLGFCLGWLGWGDVLAGFCAASLAALPVTAYLMLFRPRGRRPDVPYGPYLLVGALIAVIWSQSGR
jgi:leader peptidase (prepilin peptidase)/N-methyltransferase